MNWQLKTLQSYLNLTDKNENENKIKKKQLHKKHVVIQSFRDAKLMFDNSRTPKHPREVS